MDMLRSGRSGVHEGHEGQYIWLRYSTQFTRGGQPHTIEMEIPVPVGASAEQREHLIREAEAGIEQLYRQIEKRGVGRGQQPPEVSRPQAASAQATSSQPAPGVAAGRTPASSAQTGQAVGQANARDTSQAVSPAVKRDTAEAAAPARSSIGSEMPVSPSLSSTATGNIRLAEFIQIIRNDWALTPKDAMELLQVPNLNNMNYRELLRQLEPLVAQRNKAASKNTGNATNTTRTSSTPAAAAPRSPASSSPASPSNATRDASVRPAPSAAQSMPAPSASTTSRTSTPAPASSKPAMPAASPALDGPANIPVYPLPASTLREASRSYKFDEEEEDDEAEEAQGGNSEDENGMSEALARIKIDDLRENRGTAIVSPARLTVLHNLLDSQISDEQFQQLIEGLWNINSDKKLKQDQVEALISWAKEDYFDDEVRAVIAVLKG